MAALRASRAATGCAGLAFLLLPLLAQRLDPNAYQGGRSRDAQDRSVRNTSAVAKVLGNFRTSISDILYIKTERYLDSGIAYEPHMAETVLSASGAARGIDGHQKSIAPGPVAPAAGGDDHAGTPTVIPEPGRDYRGFVGHLHRKVKPWRDPGAAHMHSDGQQLLPWYRVMTMTDPHHVRGYTVGSWWLRKHNPDAALAFAEEGIRNNPHAFQVHLMRGQLLYRRGIERAGYENYKNPDAQSLWFFIEAQKSFEKAAELAVRQRPPVDQLGPDHPGWSDYQEEDANAAVNMAVLMERQYGDQEHARELARRYRTFFPKNAIVQRMVSSNADG